MLEDDRSMSSLPVKLLRTTLIWMLIVSCRNNIERNQQMNDLFAMYFSMTDF
jgi:hypothetical protein